MFVIISLCGNVRGFVDPAMPPVIAIALPQLSNQVVTSLSIPAQPNVPPSLEDMVRALILKTDVIRLRSKPLTFDEPFVN